MQLEVLEWRIRVQAKRLLLYQSTACDSENERQMGDENWFSRPAGMTASEFILQKVMRFYQVARQAGDWSTKKDESFLSSF
jgi:hypothetical protein